MNWFLRITDRFQEFWLGPVPAIRLRSFEWWFTASFLLYFFVARFRYWREWLTPDGYHYGIGSTPSYMVEPFPLLQPWAAIALGMCVAVAGTAILFGRLRRPMLFLLFGVAVYIQSADGLSAFALNIHYQIVFLILALSPMQPVRSVSDEGATVEPTITSAWSLRTLQATILLQFLTAGWCKIRVGEWVKHTDVLWSHVQGPYRNQLAAWMLDVLPMPVWTFMQWGAFLFEVIGPLILVIPWTRRFAILWGVGFVVFIGATMNDLLYFSFQLATYLILFLTVRELRLLQRAPERLFRRGE